MTPLELIRDELQMVRGYTLDMIRNADPAEWFRQPAEGVTHIAWQVGHLAVAEYNLGLKRVRGWSPSDSQMISDEFLTRFGKGSTPDPLPDNNPSTDEIVDVFHRVHDATMHNLADLPELALRDHVDQPHPMFTTKLGALQWCAQHEMLHVGQIGLLRRLLGHTCLR